MQYPLISEYVKAIQDASNNLDELAHLVPVQDDHGEPYRSHSALNVTALVGVLNAQDEGAVLVLGHQVGVQRGAQVANVHVAGGRGGKTGADFIARHKKTLLYIYRQKIADSYLLV